MENKANATGKIINIMITIDTDRLLKDYPHPSKDSNRPTGIAHNYGFMVATGTKVNSGQGTGDLNIQANVGDVVRVWAASASNNFDEAVLVYKLQRFSGEEVFNSFHCESFERNVPIPGGDAVLPEVVKTDNFWFYGASIRKAGKEGYNVTFAVYTRGEDGSIKPYGYYSWDPEIVVEH